ncbi:MAG: endo-1,4-beta-xylanase Z, partial [Bacteroidaceae bacterium]|nr:endo-1,4-beta-xylanase Z [Bacteroidaceae bacterium]
FARDMMTDIIPFIESNYRVLTDRNSRAIAGLSMGGMETLETSLHNVDKFAYVWVLSSSFAPGKKDYTAEAELVKSAAGDIKKYWKEFVFTQGGPSDIAYNNCKQTRKIFDEAGVQYEYMDVEGGHSWYAWRQNLYDLAQRIFKK